jgi:hypothetical protein
VVLDLLPPSVQEFATVIFDGVVVGFLLLR